MAGFPPPDYLLQSNQIKSDENVALFKSALAGSMTGVTNAIGKGGKPNFFFRPEDQKCSLHVAAEGGSTEICELLLEHGAAIEVIAAASQSTPLLLAAQNDQLSVVQLLISRNANVNAKNGYGNTSLHEATRQGFESIVDALLLGGADVNAQNKKGSTPLHFLCYGDRADVPVHLVRKLIAAGADCGVVDGRGNTPFLVCCSSGRMDIIDLLLQAGSDPTVRNSDGQDAASVAAFHHHQAVASRFALDCPEMRFGR